MRAALVALAVVTCQAQSGLPPAVPIEPVAAILDAFTNHQVVALGEGDHGNQEGAAFRRKLIADPRFADTVNDIVVETGSSRYQEQIDRYVRGEAVPATVVREACRDTSNIGMIVDLPLFQDIFHQVREINLQRESGKRIRILLGDPPLDWSRVKTIADTYAVQRDTFAANLIMKESLARGRKVLAVYGDQHFGRHRKEMLVPQLEARGARVFAVWTTTANAVAFGQSDARSWAVPSFALVRGTTLGAHEFPFWHPAKLEGQVDAVLNVGTFTRQPFPQELCADDEYRKLRTARLALQGREGELTARCGNRQ